MKMELNATKECVFSTKVVSFLVVIYPLLSVYGIPPINLGMVSMIIFYFLFLVVKDKIVLQWPKYFWLFFTYMFLLRFFNCFDFSLSSLFPLNLIVFGIVLGISCKHFDLHYGIKLYQTIVLICCVFFFFQEAMFFISGTRVVGLMPWIPLNTGMSNNDYISFLSNNDRSASFFLEPAHFAQYISPLLAVELFKNKKPVVNFYSILISLTLLLLRSGTGVIIMSVIWIIWFFYHLRNSSLIKRLSILFVLGPAFAYGVYLYLSSELGESVSERGSEFTDYSATTSAYIRIIRGYDLFDDFPVLNKLFGMNPPSKLQLFISKGEMSFLFPENDLLFSGIQSVLVFGGIIGLLIFSFHFHFLLKKTCIESRIVGVAFIIMSFMSPIYLMGEMLLCYSIMYSYKEIYNSSEPELEITN
jgi:uncharacterized membrane protein YqjE